MKIYLVGGAVRDELLGRPVKDRDWVVVGATAQQMLDLGYKQVGADFPVFLHPDTGEEYALARQERKVGTGYHGFDVTTEDVTIEADLARRDLTINSIAKDIETGEYIDPFNGQYHIKNRLLVHTSEAFAEDPLRVIRLARFAARYDDFQVWYETQQLCTEMIERGELNFLPYERFWAELRKVVEEPNIARFFLLLHSWGAFKHVKFFEEVFGPQSSRKEHWDWVNSVCQRISAIADVDYRALMLATLTRKDRLLKVQGASSDFTRLQNHLVLLDEVYTGGNAESLRVNSTYMLMKAAKPWGEGSAFRHLCDAAYLLGPKAIIQAWPLSELGMKLSEVRADQFPGLEGKELGLAIEDARKKIIKEAL